MNKVIEIVPEWHRLISFYVNGVYLCGGPGRRVLYNYRDDVVSVSPLLTVGGVKSGC